MCGIVGLLRRPGTTIDFRRIRNGLQALGHRGPDDSGFLFFAGAGHPQLVPGKDDAAAGQAAAQASGVLGSCRLSILDLSVAGHQPMSSDDGKAFIVFNGEIYNFIELRNELTELGQRFHSSSDTEVLLAAYRQWGSQCLNKLIGMFAFAVLDLPSRRLFLARDFFGIKPLYYSRTGPEGEFAFSSQVGSLLELTGAKRRPNTAKLREFLTTGWMDYGGETLFDGVHQLPPGHYIDLDLAEPEAASPVRYWDLLGGRPPATLTFGQAAEQLRELFLTSVKMHLRSDVPLASALSGGLDSSSVVAAMRAVQGPDAPIHTFTFVASSLGAKLAWNEEPWADRVGTFVGATLHKVHASPQRLAEDFERFLYLQDAPFWSPVVWVQQQIFRAAHEEGFKVMLSGQGSDEMLAGYNRHIASRIASLLRREKWISASQLLRRAADLPGVKPTAMARSALAQAVPGSLRSMVNSLRPSLDPGWLNRRWFQHRNGASEFPPVKAENVLRRVLYQDMTRSPLPALLRYEDRNSMAHSIDNRLPFLTPQMGQFALSLPEEYLVSPEAVGKAVLREAMRGLLPDETLHRKDKQGFPVPISEWLLEMEPWARRWLREADQLPFLNPSTMNQVSRRFFTGGEHALMDAFLMWRWIFVAGWARQFQLSFD